MCNVYRTSGSMLLLCKGSYFKLKHHFCGDDLRSRSNTLKVSFHLT